MKLRMVHIVHDTTVSYSHGLASLAAILERDLPSAELDLVTVRTDDTVLNARLLLDHDPDVLLFSCMSNQWPHACRLAAEIRSLGDRPFLVAGGSHIIASPSSAASSPFDLAVHGEGEEVLADIVRSPRRLDHCEVVSGPIVHDLATLPMPELSIFDTEDILAYPSVMFSRGCPYKCNYCMSRLGGIGSKVRWKSPQRAISEVMQLIYTARPQEIYIDDDTFLKNPAWVRDFCGDYARTAKIPFFCNARPETVKCDICQDLAAAGCAAVGIGIESGSERIRRDVLNRKMPDDKILQAFELVHAAGMKTWSFNMVGIPGETPEDLLATIELNNRAKTDYVRVSVYTPYPGTPLYRETDKYLYANGYIRPSAALNAEMRDIYARWLQQLADEGRLWFTRSEAALL
jgi:anaerobic magnesium-protoporphyrin IX monomethyl ester cyclase